MAKIARTYLFGKVPIDLLSTNDLVSKFVGSTQKHKKKLIVYLNVYGITQYLENSKYASTVNKADVIYADGWGPVIASKVSGNGLKERVNAADFIDELLAKLNEKKIRIYLLGDRQVVLKKAKREIEKKYEKIEICGVHSGFFDDKENKKIIREINLKKPNLVLVGMGPPKQEVWVNNNYSILPNAVYWTVGGLFNYIAGLRTRAPKFLTNNGFEWLYRFFQEPRRLWRRYTIYNMKFLWYLSKYLLKGKI